MPPRRLRLYVTTGRAELFSQVTTAKDYPVWLKLVQIQLHHLRRKVPSMPKNATLSPAPPPSRRHRPGSRAGSCPVSSWVSTGLPASSRRLNRGLRSTAHIRSSNTILPDAYSPHGPCTLECYCLEPHLQWSRTPNGTAGTGLRAPRSSRQPIEQRRGGSVRGGAWRV